MYGSGMRNRSYGLGEIPFLWVLGPLEILFVEQGLLVTQTVQFIMELGLQSRTYGKVLGTQFHNTNYEA